MRSCKHDRLRTCIRAERGEEYDDESLHHDRRMAAGDSMIVWQYYQQPDSTLARGRLMRHRSAFEEAAEK